MFIKTGEERVCSTPTAYQLQVATIVVTDTDRQAATQYGDISVGSDDQRPVSSAAGRLRPAQRPRACPSRSPTSSSQQPRPQHFQLAEVEEILRRSPDDVVIQRHVHHSVDSARTISSSPFRRRVRQQPRRSTVPDDVHRHPTQGRRYSRPSASSSVCPVPSRPVRRRACVESARDCSGSDPDVDVIRVALSDVNTATLTPSNSAVEKWHQPNDRLGSRVAEGDSRLTVAGRGHVRAGGTASVGRA